MKNYLFKLIAATSDLITKGIQGFSNWLVMVNSETGCLILRLIDKERMQHICSVLEQQEEISELGVLSQISSVVEDAVDQGQWDECHEFDLNIMANVLLNDHDWEESRIQDYLSKMINEADLRMQSKNG